jgi:hypothetical protein
MCNFATFTLVLALGGLAVRPAQAQIPDNQITHGMINCRYWEQRVLSGTLRSGKFQWTVPPGKESVG